MVFYIIYIYILLIRIYDKISNCRNFHNYKIIKYIFFFNKYKIIIILVLILYIYIQIYFKYIFLPVVPHKAVAEVSE